MIASETDALLTDRYQIAMLLGYLKSGMAERRATCELFLRRLPRTRPFLVTAGLERILRKVSALRFSEEAIGWIAAQPALAPAIDARALEYLRAFRFRGELWAPPEGTILFANEPLVRVEAALPEAQLIETLLLSIVNHDARVATKAARVVLAAAGRHCFEFGSRRTHEQAAVDAARAAFVGGFTGTSNEEAGRRWGVPVSGTCAHMWMLSFAEEGEEAAFRAYGAAFPKGTTFLVDTYDTLRGVDRAIAAAGPALAGVRLDSGDLGALSIGARERLDRAGLAHAKVVASGDLNEYKIRALIEGGARIDTFGVGTDVVATPDAPSIGAVYKLVAVENAAGATLPVAKRSEGKATYPGAKQVFRTRAGGRMAGDEVGLATEAPPGAEPLLVRWIEGGRLVRPIPPLAEVQEHCLKEVASLPAALKEISKVDATPANDVKYPVTTSPALRQLYEEVTHA